MIALFDLDDTLLDGDSNHLWGRFLVERGVLEAAPFERLQARYDAEYRAGKIAFEEYLSFTAGPLRQRSSEELSAWQRQFATQHAESALFPQAVALVDSHRRRGHALVLITATNRFFVEPFARVLGVHALLASELEQVDGCYTGRPLGEPCYREGKLRRFRAWLDAEGQARGETWFYSDSHNDIPLLEHVDNPVAVNPDAALRSLAEARRWPILQFR